MGNFKTQIPGTSFQDIVAGKDEKGEFSTELQVTGQSGTINTYGDRTVSDERKRVISESASELVEYIVSRDISGTSSEMHEVLKSIRYLGSEDIEKNSGKDSPLLRARALVTQREEKSKAVANDIIELQQILEGDDRKKARRLTALFLPAKVEKSILNKVQSKEDAISAAQNVLEERRREVVTDSAYIEQAMINVQNSVTPSAENMYWLWEVNEKLKEHVRNTAAEDEGISEQEFNDKYNALFAKIRTRYNDLATYTITSLQSYAAMDATLRMSENTEDNITRTLTTSMSLIRTAEMIESANRAQKEALRASSIVREYTNSRLEKNAELLSANIEENRKQATEPIVDLDKLESAWNKTMSALDSAKGMNAEIARESEAVKERLTQLANKSTGRIREISQ